MADIVNSLMTPLGGVRAASTAPTRHIDRTTMQPSITMIGERHWRQLSTRAIEPNGYFLPDWALAVDASARDRTGMAALSSWRGEGETSELTGLIPVIQLRRAFGILFPALVTADPYGTLGTPLLDRDHAVESVLQMMAQARHAGAHALILRDTALDGPAMAAVTAALARKKLAPTILQSHDRACLDASRDAEDILRDALGAKKLKDLRRLRNRLAEHGEIAFKVVRHPDEIAAALDLFLDLEASGWKAKRGTALKLHGGDATFIRRATAALAAQGQCEIVTLHAGVTPIAAGIILRHLDRAFYFKLGVDETFAKLSPGVQLTLDVTRYLCADPTIAMVDSTAAPGHPMIDPIWRGRLAIGDVLVPLRRFDPIVPMIAGTLSLRRIIRGPLRRVVHFVRKHKEKS